MNKNINKKLMDIYGLMYQEMGPRHWWPAKSRVEMITGAILTQFVSWKNVKIAIENLEKKGSLSIEGISETEDAELEEMIRCTRFYKQKAKKLKGFCNYLRIKYDSNLDLFFDKEMFELRKELLSLYGIGEETADCIILYAANKPIFVVDSYTRRIFSKLGLIKEDAAYGQMQKLFMDNLEANVELFNEYHAQIDGIGSKYCNGKNPKCNECPLNNICKR